MLILILSGISKVGRVYIDTSCSITSLNSADNITMRACTGRRHESDDAAQDAAILVTQRFL